uniref:Uncharacterized protein n=1 Tax=Rousettus aegyptiacus TaxID=9407 RepID=A0A7J8C2B5_ROUAE|nr:hypothetical protein HJG63_009288 [Rousettus aegyptiacus]
MKTRRGGLFPATPRSPPPTLGRVVSESRMLWTNRLRSPEETEPRVRNVEPRPWKCRELPQSHVVRSRAGPDTCIIFLKVLPAERNLEGEADSPECGQPTSSSQALRAGSGGQPPSWGEPSAPFHTGPCDQRWLAGSVPAIWL